MNHNVEIKQTITLTSTDISDLLSAAFGGNFWALVDWHTTEYAMAKQRLKDKGEEPCLEDVLVNILENNGSIIICDDEDGEKYEIVLDKLLWAIGQIIQNGYWDGKDIGDVDGIIGDAILQYACFDDVIYG